MHPNDKTEKTVNPRINLTKINFNIVNFTAESPP